MRKYLGLLLVTLLVFGVVQIGNAVTIGFDDISGNVAVTNQYAAFGINFEQTIELDNWYTGYAPIKHPGDHIAYSGSDNSSIFLFDEYVNFFSLLVTSANNILYLEAYDDSDNLLTSESKYVQIGDWHSMDIGLTSLPAQKIIIHNGSGYFAFDEIEFTTTRLRPGDVPEPSTLLLLCMGFIGFAGIKRKIRQ